MDADRKINLEGVPLNSAGAANIFLNTGKNKINDRDGTVIHLKTEKPADVGVHINTTLSIASSKKIKVLFILNFLLSVICMIISCSIAFYYWNEMSTMRRQFDVLREQFLIQNIKEGVLNQDKEYKPVQSPLVANFKPYTKGVDVREGRDFVKNEIPPKTYYVEDLGEDMLLVDSSKKNPSQDKAPTYDLSFFQKEPLVVHFNGGMQELNIGTQSLIGPWVRDSEVSSKSSESKIELNNNYFTVKESGLYFIYAQVVYLSHAPNCYFIWARQPTREPRLLTTCATGDDSSPRPLSRAQISCAVHTVARLYKGDTVNMAQREQNRTLWLRQGYSYFGFVKLSS